MRSTLWIIIVIVVGFLGFMMGYSFPPFVETGLAGGKGMAAPGQKIDKDIQDHYKDLYKEDK